eukprot:CAMPEP_0116541202 /NCGR_PEP_ID=MMETSP0397-20121206/358_1 /TAXON_ID=216820 /ORGANISM="Cyclophora tenuis, Strain ECT3854" /LENGTH=143 /DNA_ID=CAMNT_0004065131 /DNA_START=54 /DNA_END=485 /DNA_ORIENTATION=-
MACRINPSLNLERVKEAASIMLGTHDFAAFCATPKSHDDKKKQDTRNSICSINDISMVTDESPVFPNLVTCMVSVTGDRFLYKMVRFLVGSLVEVGKGTLALSDIETALANGNFDHASIPFCAPAKGLVLTNVTYKEELCWVR